MQTVRALGQCLDNRSSGKLLGRYQESSGSTSIKIPCYIEAFLFHDSRSVVGFCRCSVSDTTCSPRSRLHWHHTPTTFHGRCELESLFHISHIRLSNFKILEELRESERKKRKFSSSKPSFTGFHDCD